MVEKSEAICGGQQWSLEDGPTPGQEPNRGWVARAACRARPEVFYTHKRTTQSDVDAALALCQGCPVRRPCLQEALTHEDPWGIWGGTTEEQRTGTLAVQGHRSLHRAKRLPMAGHAAERLTAQIGADAT